jgi:hypothetical protein
MISPPGLNSSRRFPVLATLWHDPPTAVTSGVSRPSRTLTGPQKRPVPFPNGSHFDGSFPFPIALQEARRSRSLSVADDVAFLEVRGRKKRGVPNPWSVPSEEPYAGSHRGESESWTDRDPTRCHSRCAGSLMSEADTVRSNNIALGVNVCPLGRVTRSSSILSGDSTYSIRLP